MKNSKILILEKKNSDLETRNKISLILNEVHFMHLSEPRFFSVCRSATLGNFFLRALQTKKTLASKDVFMRTVIFCSIEWEDM